MTIVVTPLLTRLYSPVDFCQAGLLAALLSMAGVLAPLPVEHRREHRQYFLNCADWLVEKLQRRADGERTFHVWDYDFAWPVFGLQPVGSVAWPRDAASRS